MDLQAGQRVRCPAPLTSGIAERPEACSVNTTGPAGKEGAMRRRRPRSKMEKLVTAVEARHARVVASAHEDTLGHALRHLKSGE